MATFSIAPVTYEMVNVAILEMITLRRIVAIPFALLSLSVLAMAAITSYIALVLASFANWIARE